MAARRDYQQNVPNINGLIRWLTTSIFRHINYSMYHKLSNDYVDWKGSVQKTDLCPTVSKNVIFYLVYHNKYNIYFCLPVVVFNLDFDYEKLYEA